jgi:DNA-binding transcriptional MerR regulator
MQPSSYPIQVVAQRTGLTAHVIRIWEKRYGAVLPDRTESNRRLYSDAEIERLMLLRELTEAGQSIGYVAKLPTERLRDMAKSSAPNLVLKTPDSAQSTADTFQQQAMEATRAMDAPALDALLQRAETVLGAQGVLQKLVAPLAFSLGERWRAGDLTAALPGPDRPSSRHPIQLAPTHRRHPGGTAS